MESENPALAEGSHCVGRIKAFRFFKTRLQPTAWMPAKLQ